MQMSFSILKIELSCGVQIIKYVNSLFQHLIDRFGFSIKDDVPKSIEFTIVFEDLQ